MSLRVALIGCGAAARRLHLPGFRAAGADVTVFSSRTRASAELAASEWGSGLVIDQWRDAVARSDVDAVAVCTPNTLHAEVAIAAARAGKHVLVEKPIACTLDDADAMIEAARTAAVVLMPAHNLRFAPPFAAARAAIVAGMIGEVRSFRAALGHGGPAAWSPGADWFFDPAEGGVLLDLGIHLADGLRFLLDDEAVSVFATVMGHPVEEEAHAIVEFARGARGSIHVSWRAVPAPDHQLTVFGSTGTLHMDTAHTLTLRGADGEPRALPEPEPSDPYRAFARAVTDGAVPAVTAEDGRRALAVVLAARRSAALGRRIDLNEA